jgi:outer membrane receptor protein involved in Fe transport
VTSGSRQRSGAHDLGFVPFEKDTFLTNIHPRVGRFRIASIAVALLLSASPPFALPASAQQTSATGTLSGVVLDFANKPLGNARVVVQSASATRTVRSGPDGTFAVALPPDTYSVSASANGFQGLHLDGITVTTGPNAPLRLSLANSTLQTIGRTSTARVAALNTTSAATTTVSSQTFIDQGQSQVQNVLDQIPGVEINRSSSNEPGANSSISLRGAQPYESQVLIDGHPVVSSANGAYGFNSTFINSLLLGGVEVSKGPGNLPNTIEDAVGGTLNFETPAITEGPYANVLTGYNSFNGSYYGIKASDTFGKLGILIGIADNHTPGYLAPQTLYGGKVYPTVTAGTAFDPHVGVVDFGYHGTSDFTSLSQLAKVSYSFSPQTSILLSQYSTQTNDDESGTNDQYVNALIVPCIDKPPAGFAGTPNCAEGGTSPNYTSNPNLGLVGKSVPLNLYAPYPNTSQFDNSPIYAAEFRTVVGPGSLLARYYTGAINRIITQNYSPLGVIPCSSPACPNGNDLTTSPPTYGPGAYYGEPYVEDTIDILHGFDAQYTVPFGNNSVTAGFDRHVDAATFGEYDPTEGPPTFTQNLDVQSLAYNIRGTFALTPRLTLESGNYLSSTTYVGTRFDPRDGLVYRVNPTATVRASYGSAYVAPYYGLINASSYVSQGTLNLATGAFKPETSSGYDVGSDVKFGRNTLISVDGYLTNIFNRYASVTTQTPGTFDGKPYTMETQNGNQAVVREQGIEFQLIHAPVVGFGFHSAVDLLRDYAYNQNPNVAVDSIFSATPANNVQLPSYPYSKIRNDLFYTFANGAQARFSGTSYGANNAFGEPGYTEFEGDLRIPVKGGLVLNIGGTNLFNHDDYKAGGVYDGGYTFPALGGGSGYTTQFFAQPRTIYIELQRSIGSGGTAPLPRTSL